MTFRPALLHNRSGHRLDATHCAGPKVTELPLWGKADAPASPDERWPRVTRKTTPTLRQGPRLPRAWWGRTESTLSCPRPLWLLQRRTADGRLANSRDPPAPASGRPGVRPGPASWHTDGVPHCVPTWQRARELPGVSFMRSLIAWWGLHPHETSSSPKGPASSF